VQYVRGAAREIGQDLLIVNASAEADLDAAFATFVQRRIDGLIVGADPMFACRADRLAALALRSARRYSMKFFLERQTVLWSLPVLLLLSSCGSAGPECDSFDTRNSVVKIVSDDSNNALVDYAAKNSSVIGARVNKASTEAERLAIWETARQGASYRLGAIGTNPKSKDRRAVNCSGVLSVTVEDATAEKQVDFKIEQMPDGKVSVSVSPFQF
jgi:hypothetical protein